MTLQLRGRFQREARAAPDGKYIFPKFHQAQRDIWALAMLPVKTAPNPRLR